MATHKERTDATKLAITNSFWELYKTTPIEHITVNMVAGAAHVHRSTFYRYFPDTFAILEQIEDALIEDFIREYHSLIATRPDITIQEFLPLSVNHLRSKADALYHLMGANGDPGFRARFQAALLPVFCSINHLSIQDIEQQFYVTLIASILLTSLNFWYEHQQDHTLEELNELCQPMVLPLVQRLR